MALVAVKVLKEGASRETREDFKREVEIMSSFDHENILKLIGVVAIGKSRIAQWACRPPDISRNATHFLMHVTVSVQGSKIQASSATKK